MQKQPDAAYLLRATFMKGERAIDAWHAWSSLVDLSGDVDRESYRLLPQLVRNLGVLGIDDPLAGKFKGISRHTWYKNKLLIERSAPLLDQLYKAGTGPLLVGEAAMLMLSKSDYGLYPIDAFNILVHPEQSAQTLEQLHKSGWHLISGVAQAVDALLEHSTFVDEEGHIMRVNWRLLPEYGGTNLDDDVWEGASPVVMRGTQVYVQNAADQLLSVCAHGLCAQDVSFYGRVGEAMTLLNAFGGEIDWQRLLAQARNRRLLMSVSSVLGYIQRDLEAPVPQEVWDTIDAQTFSSYERIEQRLLAVNGSPVKRMGRLWFRYRRLTDDRTPWQLIRSFPVYLRHRWQLQHTWQVPLRAVELALSLKREGNEDLSEH